MRAEASIICGSGCVQLRSISSIHTPCHLPTHHCQDTFDTKECTPCACVWVCVCVIYCVSYMIVCTKRNQPDVLYPQRWSYSCRSWLICLGIGNKAYCRVTWPSPICLSLKSLLQQQFVFWLPFVDLWEHCSKYFIRLVLGKRVPQLDHVPSFWGRQHEKL